MKKHKLCKRKQCLRRQDVVRVVEARLQQREQQVLDLQDKLAKKQIDQSRSSEALVARTELIKALGWAMKTCSSIAWSDRTVYGQKP